MIQPVLSAKGNLSGKRVLSGFYPRAYCDRCYAYPAGGANARNAGAREAMKASSCSITCSGVALSCCFALWCTGLFRSDFGGQSEGRIAALVWEAACRKCYFRERRQVVKLRANDWPAVDSSSTETDVSRETNHRIGRNNINTKWCARHKILARYSS